MELSFHLDETNSTASPPEGDVWVHPRDGDSTRHRELAKLILEAGLDGLRRGPGAARRVLVSHDPTLDDMLAAGFAVELLEGRPIPSGAGLFAEYACLIRQGLQAQARHIPLEESLEGLFFALRNAYGEDLRDAATAGRFAADWRRLFARVLEAARAGLDPFKEPLPLQGAEFARERAFLRRDQDVYRADVEAGERWEVRLPGSAGPGGGLLLRQPKCLLFKDWSRSDRDAPVGTGYSLLVVHNGPGGWIASTDPVHRLSLKPLYEALQRAEDAAARAAATAPRWFDGAPFNHTLIASPRAPRTALTDDAVLRVIKGSVGAKAYGSRRLLPPDVGPRRGRRIASALAAIVVAVGALIGLWRSVHETQRGTLGPVVVARPPQPDGPGNSYALVIGITEYGDRRWPRLPGARPDAVSVAAFVERQGFQVTTLYDDEAKKERIIKVLQNDFAPRLVEGDRVLVYFAGHGYAETLANRKWGYLIPYDHGESSSSYLDMAELERQSAKMGLATHQLFILDACHSGLAAEPLGAVLTRGVDPRFEARAPTQVAVPARVAELRRRASRQVITAGGGDQSVQDGGSGSHSLFTGAFLEAVEQGLAPHQGDFVTAMEVYTYVSSRASDEIQTPGYGRWPGHGLGDFVFELRREPAAGAG